MTPKASVSMRRFLFLRGQETTMEMPEQYETKQALILPLIAPWQLFIATWRHQRDP